MIMKLCVVSHKPCWASTESKTGYATDGGFAFQMRAIAELFNETRVVVPVYADDCRSGQIPLDRVVVQPLTPLTGSGIQRKLRYGAWLLHNLPLLVREILEADAVHAPIPSDIGTAAMLIAAALRKPLFVRHCGNWLVAETTAERFWKWFMQRFAGGRNVFLTTGGADEPPSGANPNLKWIFSTSLTRQELDTYRRPRMSVPKHPRLAIACRQEEKKGTDVVLASLPLIAQHFPGITLDVIGDGTALPQFRDQAAALGVSERVRFHGKVSHEALLEILQHVDLFCYPTTASEGFPKVVLEALACGLPVVTTPVSVLPQLMKNGCGVLIHGPDPAVLADAVRTCLEDDERYRGMSLSAVSVAAGFSLERWRDFIGDRLRAAWGPLHA
jgi:glycosyltransferase involved in cell wall biosynthesis